MSLEIPNGHLSQVNINDPQDLIKLLSFDKHQLLEGLVIEGLFKKYLEYLKDEKVLIAGLDLVKARDIDRKKTVWWLWNHDNAKQLSMEIGRRITISLKLPAMHCEYRENERDFYLIESGSEESVQQYMRRERNIESPLEFKDTHNDVKNESRTLQSFWGGMHGIYPDTLFRDVVIHRLFKNFAIQPFFTYAWDIDQLIQLENNQIIQLEVKHKYPYIARNENTYFGINNGQVNVINDLCQIGINTLHMIMVKPYWTSEKSPSYTLQDPTVKQNVLFLACYFDSKRVRHLKKVDSSTAPKRTSLDGKSVQSFKPVPVEKFSLLGTLHDDPQKIAENIKRAALGEKLEPVTAELLNRYRLQK